MSLDNDIDHVSVDDNTEKSSKVYRLPAPQNLRYNEVREGGFIVIERTRKKRLLRPAPWPIEAGDLPSAVKAVRRLQEKEPQKEYCIFEQVGSFPVEKSGK